MAVASCLCRDLDCDSVKTRVITIGVAPDQSFDLVGAGHGGGSYKSISGSSVANGGSKGDDHH
jgi:hypothetical protein